MTLRRGPWEEAQLRGEDPDELLLLHPGWTNNRDSLVLSLRETGWFGSSAQAWEAAERATLHWGFIGTDDDGNLVICTPYGMVHGTDESVSDVQQVTVARITTPG